MRSLSRLKTLSTLLLLSTLASCKLGVIVVDGGQVTSGSSGTCMAQTNCVHEITDTNYTETFTAVPAIGWNFLRWNTGGDFLCGDSTNPVCVVSTVPLTGIPVGESIIASQQSFYIMPVFEENNLPITDTITVLGTEWAQPSLFITLSWFDINLVCNASIGGACSGILNGWNMDGWVWADLEAVTPLFNSYGVLPPLANSPDGRSDFNTTWAPAFFSDGWNPTLDFPVGPQARREVEGWLQDVSVSSGQGPHWKVCRRLRRCGIR